MKSVLISIKPNYCELIAIGKKTIEVRKSKPKLETPFKCFIYECKGKEVCKVIDIPNEKGGGCIDCYEYEGCGEVIGEFVCDNIDKIHVPTELMYEKEIIGFSEHTLDILNKSCLSYDDIVNYSGCSLDNYNSRKEYLYGWYISNLVIFDKPKELREFIKAGALGYDDWLYGLYNEKTQSTYENYLIQFKVIYPPQSWCYVEV